MPINENSDQKKNLNTIRLIFSEISGLVGLMTALYREFPRQSVRIEDRLLGPILLGYRGKYLNQCGRHIINNLIIHELASNSSSSRIFKNTAIAYLYPQSESKCTFSVKFAINFIFAFFYPRRATPVNRVPQSYDCKRPCWHRFATVLSSAKSIIPTIFKNVIVNLCADTL